MRIALFLALLLALTATLHAQDKKPAAKEEAKDPSEAITQKEIDSINYDNAAVDNGFVTPLAQDLSHLDDDRKLRLDEFTDKFEDFKSGQEKQVGQLVRNWMAVCTYGDLGRSEFEAEVPYVVFEKLKKDIPREKLIKALAWVIVKPKEGTTVTKAPELGIEDELDENEVRARSAIYAKKLLGRLVGKLPPKE